jgi:hypothetical protein
MLIFYYEHVAAPTLLCLFCSCLNMFIRGMLSHKLRAGAGTHWHLPLQETCKYPRSDLCLSFPSQRLKTIPIFAFLPISTVQNHTPWISPHAPARYSWGDNSNGQIPIPPGHVRRLRSDHSSEPLPPSNGPSSAADSPSAILSPELVFW